MTPSIHCRNKTAHLNCTYFIFHTGKSAVRYNGEVFTEQEFIEKYPIHGEANKTERQAQRAKDNPDNSRKFML